jgi:LmbE family N-acetylglucosaminyl deacetylase
LAPHPDDEVLGAGATLMALRDAGSRVVNLACSLGRSEERERREQEVREASARTGFELVIHDPPLAISAEDDLDAAQATLARTLGETIAAIGAEIVVSPSPHDGHHGHEVVGRAARDALRALRDSAPRWWMWGLWAELPFPTLVSLFGADRLDALVYALEAHAGEIARNDFADLARSRATVARVIGAEKAFGYGAEGFDRPHADLLTEAIAAGGRWTAAAPRVLDPVDPLAGGEPAQPLDWWLDAESYADRMRRESAAQG